MSRSDLGNFCDKNRGVYFYGCGWYTVCIVKQLFAHIKKSIYGPEYYRELHSRPISFSFKYYAGFAMALALLLTIIYSIPLVPLISSTLRTFPQHFAEYYPDELVVPIVGGKATTTVSQPFYLPIPAIFEEQLSREFDIEHLGVIDTTAPVTLEKFREHRALFWIAENGLAVRGSQGEMKVSAFDPDIDITIDEQRLLGIINSLQPYFKFVVPALVLAIFVGLCLAFTINLVYLFFPALILYIVMLFQKNPWTYGTAFQVCLHATTLPLLLSMMLAPLGFNMGSLPLASTMLLLIVVFVNMRADEPAAPTAAEAAPTVPTPPPAGE